MRQGLVGQERERTAPDLFPAPDVEIDEASEPWARVSEKLKKTLGPGTFTSWFGGVSLMGLEERCVMLTVPSKFIQDWITVHYEEHLRRFWQEEEPRIQTVRLILKPAGAAGRHDCRPANRSGYSHNAEEAKRSGAPRSPSAASPGELRSSFLQAGGESVTPFPAAGLGTPLDPRYIFDDFIVGENNKLAYDAACRIARQGEVGFNPLYIYGPVGLGKTHLLHAIAWQIRRADPSQNVLYLSAERFMYHFVRAIKVKDTLTFKDLLGSVDVLLLDDVQFIAHKGSTQEEFFHTFNALMGENRQVVISANQPPSDLDGVGERIRSRLGHGLVVDIGPTDYALRLGILEKKVERMNCRREAAMIPRPVLEFLARSIDSNVRVLEGALNRLAAYADYADRPISLDAARDILTDLLRASARKITIADIQRAVVDYFQISQKELISARRARDVVRPRHVGMYLCKHLTTRSFLEIGRKFGGRDHSTVYHAVNRVSTLMKKDDAIAHDVARLTRQLQG